MLTVMEWAQSVLLGPKLEDKLRPISLTAPMGEFKTYTLPQTPGRIERLAFSDKQLKFPKGNALGTSSGRSIAIHSFANHELLAIEMMAAALLVYPHFDATSERMKRGILAALRDEQKHLALYIQRLNEDGVEFGDMPLNNFFWRQMEKLKTPDSFFSLMALTFESANLDFSLQYESVFRQLGDEKTANIMKQVYEDEITHVALGAHWMGIWKKDQTLWDYYRSVLPYPLTPARAKGSNYRPETRRAAGLEEDWVLKLGEFVDEFKVTNRKSWNLT
ncbi:MAG: ferritin-like domain-containing protein [Bacteriovoracaceae bacterium]|nr:ferritin-like domain-containing protein [Bacteriovoracaceae bacterium]